MGYVLKPLVKIEVEGMTVKDSNSVIFKEMIQLSFTGDAIKKLEELEFRVNEVQEILFYISESDGEIELTQNYNPDILLAGIAILSVNSPERIISIKIGDINCYSVRIEMKGGKINSIDSFTGEHDPIEANAWHDPIENIRKKIEFTTAGITKRKLKDISTIIEAIDTKDVKTVARFIESGGSFSTGEDGISSNALYYICSKDLNNEDLMILNYILQKNESINDQSFCADLSDSLFEGINSGLTPLILQARYTKSTKGIEALLSNGADINLTDDENMTALQVAVMHNTQPLIARHLFNLSEDESIVRLLRLALFNDNIDVFWELYPELLDINQEDYKAATILTYVSKYCKDIKIFKKLFDDGADICRTDEQGVPILSYLAEANPSLEIFELCLDNCYNLEITDDDGGTALLRASAYCGIDIIKLFIQHGSDFNAKDMNEMGVLHYAAMKNDDPNVLDLFVESGININDRNDIDGTPLGCAAGFNKPNIVERVLKLGGDLSFSDKDGDTALHEVCYNQSNTEYVDIFVKYGANINIKNNDGKTPLHVTAEEGDLQIYRYLIEIGADTEILDENGKKAIDYLNERNKT